MFLINLSKRSVLDCDDPVLLQNIDEMVLTSSVKDDHANIFGVRFDIRMDIMMR